MLAKVTPSSLKATKGLIWSFSPYIVTRFHKSHFMLTLHCKPSSKLSAFLYNCHDDTVV